MAKQHGLNPQNGFKVSELVLGGLYECRISGRLVLMVDEKERRKIGDPVHKDKIARMGKAYNSTNGQYDLFAPHDFQLKYPSK